MRLFRSAEEKAQSAAAEAKFSEIIGRLAASDPNQAKQLAADLGSAAIAALGARERKKLGEQAFVRYADNALADDHLTEEEEDALTTVAEAVGFGQEDFERHDLYTRIQVAKLNDGRLPVVEDPSLMAKKAEVVHLETAAALMKEVAVREWRGGSQGVSFRVAKGVRYRVGSTRGHLVTVGTQLQVGDTGKLVITSQRAVFLGDHKTIEMPYTKLLALQQYADALSFSLSNRQSAPLIKITISTEVLAALINAAAQKSQT